MAKTSVPCQANVAKASRSTFYPLFPTSIANSNVKAPRTAFTSPITNLPHFASSSPNAPMSTHPNAANVTLAKEIVQSATNRESVLAMWLVTMWVERLTIAKLIVIMITNAFGIPMTLIWLIVSWLVTAFRETRCLPRVLDKRHVMNPVRQETQVLHNLIISSKKVVFVYWYELYTINIENWDKCLHLMSSIMVSKIIPERFNK